MTKNQRQFFLEIESSSEISVLASFYIKPRPKDTLPKIK